MDTPEKVSEPYVPATAAADIKRFGLTPQTFRDTLTRPHRRSYITDDIKHYMTLEGSYSSFVLEPGQKAPDIPVDDRMLIGTKGHQCPHCFDDGEVRLEGVGTKTGLRIYMHHPCQCKQYNWYYRHWNNTVLVPDNYRDVKLSTIEQFKDDARFANWTGRKHDHLKGERTGVEWEHLPVTKLFETLKQYPDQNYLFCGRAGTGKTTCLLALYQKALWDAAKAGGGGGCEYIWKVNANDLSNEFFEWKTRSDKTERLDTDPIIYSPTVTVGKILAAFKAGLKPRLFIEEIDKFNLGSDFQRNSFWAIFEALSPRNGQIVATTNVNHNRLAQKLGEQHGEAIMRRIEGGPNGIYIDFTGAEIINTLELPDATATPPVEGAEVVAQVPRPPRDLRSVRLSDGSEVKFDSQGRPKAVSR